MTINHTFNIFEKEPLLYFLYTKLKLNPLKLGLAFFVVISLSLTLCGILNTPTKPPPGFISYLDNISWSISMLLLFPFVVGLTLHYYLAIPKLFSSLANLCPSLDVQDFNDFIAGKQRWFNHAGINAIFILLVISLNAVYFAQILGDHTLDWIKNGEIFRDFLQNHLPSNLIDIHHGFSKTGLYAAVIQTILSYWVVNLVWRSFIFSWALFSFFNDTKPGSPETYRFNIPITLLHPDGACGLKGISRIAMIFNLILFLFGIYISLKVVDILIIQQGTLAQNIGNPVFLFCYVFLAPFLFFLPLAAAHKRMRDAKLTFLIPLVEKRDQLILSIRTGFSTKLVEEINELDALYDHLNKTIPVWPFNYKSVEAFFIAIVTPLLPAVLPVIMHILQIIMKP